MTLIHGGDIFSLAQQLECKEEEILDFSVNINPLGLSPKVRACLIDHIDLAVRYPDPLCRQLVDALSRVHGLEQDKILCGNGAADLIFRFVYVCKPKRALVLAPTFAEYEEALKQVGCQVAYYLLKEKDHFKVQEDFLEQLTPDLDMIWLCNPNNPTGQVTSKNFLVKVLEKCEKLDIKVIVDECFMDFVKDAKSYSLINELEKFKCLTILKAFTKFYAMAGLRLGYGLFGDSELKKQLEKASQPWAVSGLAQLAGVVALEDEVYETQTRQVIEIERVYMQACLTALGFTCYPSCANYLLFQSPIPKLKEKLMEKGILIRHCGNYQGLTKDYYRIGIKTRKDNELLIHALKQIAH